MSFPRESALATRSDTVPVPPEIAPLIVDQAYILTYIGYAMLTVVAYSAITTFDKEVHYFWRKPFSIVGCIFFLNRFFGFLGAITYIMSQTTQWLTQLSTVGNVALIDYILLLRLLALYSQNKKVAIVMRTLFTAEACAFLALVTYSSVVVDYTPGEFTPSLILCGTSNPLPPLLGPLTWSVVLAYGTILMCLALYKAFEHWKETEGIKGFDLAKVLIQDQALYYSVIIFCAVSNIVATADVGGSTLQNVLKAAGDPALLCVLGSHLLIHLKEAAEKGLNGGTSYRLEAISAIDFDLNFGDNDDTDSNHDNAMVSKPEDV